MAIQPMALGLRPVEINAVDDFARGAANASNLLTADSNRQTAELDRARQGLETIGSMALGVMGGDIEGQPDPALFEQGLDFLEGNGIDVASYRGRADLAPLLARSSMTALQQIQTAQNQQQLDLAMQKFEHDVTAAMNAPIPAPETETIYDSETGREIKVQWDGEAGGWVPIGGVKAGEGQVRTLTPAEAEELGLDPAKVYQVEPDGTLNEVGGSLVEIHDNSGQSETEYDKTVGKGYGDRFLAIQDAEETARSALNSLTVMEQAMARPGFYSGAGAEQIAQLKRWGQALGLDAEGIDGIEAFNAQAKSAALDAMGGSLGTGFSNADRDFVLDQVPQLANSPQGNAALIRVQKAINGRKIEIAQRARDYAAENNGRIDAGFYNDLAQWAEANPIFSEGSIFPADPDDQPNTTSAIAQRFEANPSRWQAETAPDDWTGPKEYWDIYTPEERASWP